MGNAWFESVAEAQRLDDARRAAGAGVTAIAVSNHGGNDLDGTLLGLGRSSIHDLSPVVIPPGFTRTLGTAQTDARRRAA